MANAGRILIIPRGNYDSSKTYEMLDLVNHNGVSWLAKKTVTGIEPSEGEYWHPLLGISIANDLNTEAEGKVLDARQGKVIGDKLKEVSEMTDIDYTEGLYARKIGRQVTIFFDGYKVTGTEEGNGGNIGLVHAPMRDVIFPLVVPGVGICVGLINTAGYLSLYNADQSQYVSGSVSGTVSYMTSEP